jgi:hypothetical protein
MGHCAVLFLLMMFGKKRSERKKKERKSNLVYNPKIKANLYFIIQQPSSANNFIVGHAQNLFPKGFLQQKQTYHLRIGSKVLSKRLETLHCQPLT